MAESRAHSVLVTGAAGYLGRLVVRALAHDRRGIETLVAADVRPPGAGDRLDGVEYVTADIRDPATVELLAEHRIDTVVHLAAIMNADGATPPELAYQVDVVGTEKLLAGCVEHGVGKLIVTSSGAAYGYHPDNPALIDEEWPIRGNQEFSYSHHKRLVEELLAEYRSSHPELAQLVFRPGTVLGRSVKNQITALFEKPVVLGLKGVATPFVFIWDQDVVACLVAGVHGDQTGIYNLAGDGVMTLREIALALHKPYLPLPIPALTRGLGLLRRFGLTRYGPEQVDFLRYRPVLSNQRLKSEFGYTPRRTSREVFDLYRESHA